MKRDFLRARQVRRSKIHLQTMPESDSNNSILIVSATTENPDIEEQLLENVEKQNKARVPKLVARINVSGTLSLQI